MKPGEVVVLWKWSKVQRDTVRTRADAFELDQIYHEEGLTDEEIENIFRSDKAQSASYVTLRKLLGREVHFVNLEEDAAADAGTIMDNLQYLHHQPLLITLGGDETFTGASLYRERLDDGLILGLNSDPETSKGKLLWGSVDDLAAKIHLLWKREFSIERRVRLEAFLDDAPLGLASSHIFLGAEDPELMSRYELHLPDGRREQQKSSGLLVTTGGGSTGWYRSARYTTEYDFARDAQLARFFVREPYRDDDDLTFELLTGDLLPGKELVVRSLHARGGRISLDGRVDRDEQGHCTYNQGKTARIRISNRPLNVVKF